MSRCTSIVLTAALSIYLVACGGSGEAGIRLSPDDVIARLQKAGLKAEKTGKSLPLPYEAKGDIGFVVRVDGNELMLIRYKTDNEARDFCQTRRRCVSGQSWAVDADQFVLDKDPVPLDKIRESLASP